MIFFNKHIFLMLVKLIHNLWGLSERKQRTVCLWGSGITQPAILPFIQYADAGIFAHIV